MGEASQGKKTHPKKKKRDEPDEMAKNSIGGRPAQQPTACPQRERRRAALMKNQKRKGRGGGDGLGKSRKKRPSARKCEGRRKRGGEMLRGRGSSLGDGEGEVSHPTSLHAFESPSSNKPLFQRAGKSTRKGKALVPRLKHTSGGGKNGPPREEKDENTAVPYEGAVREQGGRLGGKLSQQQNKGWQVPTACLREDRRVQPGNKRKEKKTSLLGPRGPRSARSAKLSDQGNSAC